MSRQWKTKISWGCSSPVEGCCSVAMSSWGWEECRETVFIGAVFISLLSVRVAVGSPVIVDVVRVNDDHITACACGALTSRLARVALERWFTQLITQHSLRLKKTALVQCTLILVKYKTVHTLRTIYDFHNIRSTEQPEFEHRRVVCTGGSLRRLTFFVAGIEPSAPSLAPRLRTADDLRFSDGGLSSARATGSQAHIWFENEQSRQLN